MQLRYKEPTGAKSRLINRPVKIKGATGEPTGDFRFATAVAAFGLVLRDSEYKGTATLDQVLSLAQGYEGEDPEDGPRGVRPPGGVRSSGGSDTSDDIP